MKYSAQRNLSFLPLIMAWAFLLSVALPHDAFADCSTDSPPTCVYIPDNTTVTLSPTLFTPTPPNYCKKITTNKCYHEIMVPLGSIDEWEGPTYAGGPVGFVNSTFATQGGCVTLADCETYTWVAGGWGSCTSTCGTGTQSQTVTCHENNASTRVVSTVNNSYCTSYAPGIQPPTSRSCSSISSCVYTAGGYGSCSTQCGAAAQTLYPATCWNSTLGVPAALSYCNTSVGEQCNAITCGACSSAPATPGGSFVLWTAYSPGGPTCGGLGNSVNPETGDYTCPSGYTDGLDVNTGGSIGSEHCTGYTHNCISTCESYFENAEGKGCAWPWNPSGVLCVKVNPQTGSCTCPLGTSPNPSDLNGSYGDGTTSGGDFNNNGNYVDLGSGKTCSGRLHICQ